MFLGKYTNDDIIDHRRKGQECIGIKSLCCFAQRIEHNHLLPYG